MVGRNPASGIPSFIGIFKGSIIGIILPQHTVDGWKKSGRSPVEGKVGR